MYECVCVWVCMCVWVWVCMSVCIRVYVGGGGILSILTAQLVSLTYPLQSHFFSFTPVVFPLLTHPLPVSSPAGSRSLSVPAHARSAYARPASPARTPGCALVLPRERRSTALPQEEEEQEE